MMQYHSERASQFVVILNPLKAGEMLMNVAGWVVDSNDD